MIGGVIGTAGHIDHGKTALVRALTGIHTDRLPEEQRRGISIDLGFSHLDLPDRVLGVVDVPGHEDFIRNMVAGATGIDVLLLVVAADEGVMPQTREHVAIAELLGVPRAVVALTKTDLVDDDWRDLAAEDVTGFLAATSFADAPVLPVSATTGRGLDALLAAIDEAAAGTRGRPDDRFRLPVDRAFTVRGTGTVVTGTVWSGALERDARVRLLPGGAEARVRGLQVHGADAASVAAGQRAAIALAGLDREAVTRGMTLVAGRAWTDTSILTVQLRALAGTGWGLEHRQRVRVHLATAEVMARVVLLEEPVLEEGAAGLAQLRLESPLVARYGDRLVLRSYSPVTTIGGGVVLEPRAPRRNRLRDRDRPLLDALRHGDAVARLRASLDAAGGRGLVRGDLPLDLGLPPAAVDELLMRCGAALAGEAAFSHAAVDAVRTRMVAAVRAHHERRPLQAGIDPAELRRAGQPESAEALVELALSGLLEAGDVVMRGGRVALPGHRPALTPDQEALRDAVLRTLADGRDSPPRLDDLRGRLGDPPELGDLLEFLEDAGHLERIDSDFYMERAEVDRLIAAVRGRLAGRDGLSPTEFRAIIPLSRRHLIPILEYLDRRGVTVRKGEGRSVPAS